MALTKEEKEKIIKEFAQGKKDTGSTEVQVALLTEQINALNKHLKEHPKDFHSKRGLFVLVWHRKKLLAYLKDKSLTKYQALIEKLGLRR